jgi:breast cancer 2 susceptibility protein
MTSENEECFTIGKDEMKEALIMAGANPRLATMEWVSNHYRWIVWKLACTERKFPSEFSGRYLNAENVLYQLKYRYEREINRCQRSAIKKILEKDAASSRYMVLCVASIKGIKTFDKKEGEEAENSNGFIELTDGWYSVRIHSSFPFDILFFS